MPCTITAGIGIVCADLRRTGGLAKQVWLGNITDLRAQFNVDTTANITSIELVTYATLYKFEGAKFAHSATSDMKKTDSGNVSFEHSLQMRVYNTSIADDQILESLSTSDVFAVVQTMNDDFLIYGAANGMSASEIKAQSGKNSGDDSTTMVTLLGSERTMPKRFFDTSKTQTLARLNAQSA